jgi:hypothetical protein
VSKWFVVLVATGLVKGRLILLVVFMMLRKLKGFVVAHKGVLEGAR